MNLLGLKRIWQNKWQFGAVVVLLSISFALLLGSLSALEDFELETYDIRFGIRGQVETAKDSIVVVAIDDTTLRALKGYWPLPNLVYANAIANLLDAGAKLVVLNTDLFATDSVNSLQDRNLMRIVRASDRVVLSGEVTDESVSKPMSLLLQNGARWGIRNLKRDHDGQVREYSLFLERGDQIYFSLATEALLALSRFDPEYPKAEIAQNGFFRIAGLKIGPRELGSILINYRGPAGAYARHSFSSVVDDAGLQLGDGMDRNAFQEHVRSGSFRNKIVFLGQTFRLLAPGEITPFTSYKGRELRTTNVEIHAHALSSLMRSDFITRQSAFVRFFMVLVMSALAMVAIMRFGATRGILMVLGLVTVLLLWSLFAFINFQIWVEITSPLLAVFFATAGSLVQLTVVEQRSRRRLRKVWQRYLPQETVRSMLERDQLPSLAGERRELTVLFSDIRGFTSFSERHSSKEVVARLNQYMTSMVDVIFQHSGTLDKLVGDEIVAIFGAPQSYQNHSERACLAALAMVEKLADLQQHWARYTSAYDNVEPLRIGIGVNTGNVILGNIGSAQHFNYSVIGDDVNLAASLEAANKIYDTQIVISEFTYKSVRRKARVRELDVVRFKGKHKSVRIFELLGMDALPLIEQDLLVHVYTQGLNHFKAQRWYEALVEFKRIIRYFPTDGPTRLYIKRCMDFIENPPSPNWDGVRDDSWKSSPELSMKLA